MTAVGLLESIRIANHVLSGYCVARHAHRFSPLLLTNERKSAWSANAGPSNAVPRHADVQLGSRGNASSRIAAWEHHVNRLPTPTSCYRRYTDGRLN